MSRLAARLSDVIDQFVEDFRSLVRSDVTRELRDSRSRRAVRDGSVVRERLFNTQVQNREEIRAGILSFLATRPASVGELAEMLSTGRRRVVASLHEMRDEGKVAQTGSGRATKYLLV